jgi:hypothetical protein
MMMTQVRLVEDILAQGADEMIMRAAMTPVTWTATGKAFPYR